MSCVRAYHVDSFRFRLGLGADQDDYSFHRCATRTEDNNGSESWAFRGQDLYVLTILLGHKLKALNLEEPTCHVKGDATPTKIPASTPPMKESAGMCRFLRHDNMDVLSNACLSLYHKTIRSLLPRSSTAAATTRLPAYTTHELVLAYPQDILNENFSGCH